MCYNDILSSMTRNLDSNHTKQKRHAKKENKKSELMLMRHESLWQFLFAANISLSPSILSHLTLLQPNSHKIIKIF